MIFEKIKAIIVEELGIDESQITLETNFQNDLEADSLDVFQVISEIEEAFDIEMDIDQDMETVQDLVHYIEQQQ